MLMDLFASGKWRFSRAAAAVTIAAGHLAGCISAFAGDKPGGPAYAPSRTVLSPGISKPPLGLPADHADIDTEHIFGFSMGSDIGKPGEIEVEFENVGAFGKRSGSYAALANLNQVKYTVSDNFRIAPGFSLSGQRIRGVPGLADHQDVAFSGAALELRYKLVDRAVAPFGLTLHAQPGWSRIDDASGIPIAQYGAEFAALFDRELIKDRLFAAFNVWYGTGGTREIATDLWRHDSEMQLQAALSYAVRPELVFGLGVRYARAYDGGALNRFAGDAIFAGPTFSYTISKEIGISGTWQMQVAGSALGDNRSLNLDQFERHQALLRLNLHF
ncbi:hypothetical protein [Bradyrhizobium cosmicum]|uniref:hypothetical protein n=1 Tax=Bradyrhizobium cosmicum TaxID=1404864 RepID=UPI0011650314|nr:hypothetical protein [Bradyrhizobium cosmicum]QDP24804.1 hypothetical protein FNV92_22760 [Bradyrhizobium cosmicum]